MRKKVVDICGIVLIALAILSLGFAIWCFVFDMKMDQKEYTLTTIPMTEEQLAARPVAKQPEKIEVVEVVEEVPEFTAYDVVPLPEELQIHAQKICKEYHVSYAFFLAMCESESSFASNEVEGDSGRSIGYMQINKPNWNRYDLNAFIPEENIEIGIRMMGEYIVKYQEFDMVVMCYKGGESAALKWRDEGFRLGACDELVDATMWWEGALNNERNQ